MKRVERFLERKIFLKRQHVEIIRREIEDLRRELKKENRKLTWNQAFNQAEKELGKIEKALKPITQDVIDSIKKEIKGMKNGPKTPEDARALARIKARERGYDPEKRATE